MKTLPNPEEVVKDVYQSIDDWRQLANPIEEALNIRLYGFCPDLQFIDNDTNEFILMSVSLAKKIIKAIT